MFPHLQLLHGYHGLKPSGPVVDFILKNHTHFSGGIIWLNGTVPDLIAGAMECITMVRKGIKEGKGEVDREGEGGTDQGAVPGTNTS